MKDALSDFLAAEGITSDAVLHQALRADGKDGIPLLLERGRHELRSGPYTCLRSACEAAGGLREVAPPPAQHSERPRQPQSEKPSGADDLLDFDNYSVMLQSQVLTIRCVLPC